MRRNFTKGFVLARNFRRDFSDIKYSDASQETEEWLDYHQRLEYCSFPALTNSFSLSLHRLRKIAQEFLAFST